MATIRANNTGIRFSGSPGRSHDGIRYSAPVASTLGAADELLDRIRGFGCGVHQASVCATMEVWNRDTSVFGSMLHPRWSTNSPRIRRPGRSGRPDWPQGGLRQEADGWVADSPMGTVTVEFSPPNRFGVLDHVVRMPSGEEVYNPLRVVPGGVGAAECEVVFTVRRRPGMTDDEFAADAAAVAADLATLARLVQRLTTVRSVSRLEGAETQPDDGAGGRSGQHGGRGARRRDGDDDQHNCRHCERQHLVYGPGHSGDADLVTHGHGLTIARK